MKEKPNIFLLNRVKYDSSLISFSASWQANIFFQKKFFELFNPCSYSFHFFDLFTDAVTVSIFPNYLIMCSYSFFLPELILHKSSVTSQRCHSRQSPSLAL